MLALLTPLLIPLFYRNSFEYFYVFMLPPVLVALAPAAEQVVLPRVRFAICVALMVSIGTIIATIRAPIDRKIRAAQQQTIAVAHQLFPQPITYFDFSGYLGDYDRALPFMLSGWGLKGYRERGHTAFINAMKRKTIPLLIANHGYLLTEVSGQAQVEYFIPEDAQALRENYIHHWGMLWVAGRVVPTGDMPLEIHNRVPGAYTVEGGSIRIDGKLYDAGDLVTLSRSVHAIDGNRKREVTLRWGNNLEIPDEEMIKAGPFQPLWFFP
ncbi:hypothetical protein [Sulfitobacter aestuariivivens]